MEKEKAEALWELELQKAQEMVKGWTESGSVEDLVEKILEQEELDRELAQESVRKAVEVAVKALAQLKVAAAELREQAAEHQNKSE